MTKRPGVAKHGHHKIYDGANYVLVSPSKQLLEATVFGHFYGNGSGEFILFKVGKNNTTNKEKHPPYTECKCQSPTEHMNAINAERRASTKER